MLRTINRRQLATITGGFNWEPLMRRKGKSQEDAKLAARNALMTAMSAGISGGAAAAGGGEKKKA